MNKVNIMSLATVCGVLAQPTAMAEAFIQSPAPVVYRSDADGLSHEKLAEFTEQLSIGKSLVKYITENADNLYFNLIEMSADEARIALSATDIKNSQASEFFLRAFEIEINSASEKEGMPDFIVSEMKSYGRLIARSRSVVTRLNGYVKQLSHQPKTFESEINFDALRELASATSEKLSTKQFH
ncbi:hypothetical protein [Rouxiella sp. Mn2063]|uniref:hypothetical protein n=1 Tax=Rouxiella sp. Mn2063 TaxID=3395262 RepID=UPI003BC55F55